MPIRPRETSIYPEGLLDGPEADPPKGDQVWWAVFTKSRQEKALARDLVAFHVPFYLPQVRKENRIRGRQVFSHIPLFPGYVFLYGGDDEKLQAVMTNRVCRVLPVPGQGELRRDLEHLRHLIETDFPLTVEQRLMPGERVRIKSGPLSGVEGTISTRRGRTRLMVAVNFLQNGVSVEIDDFMVEPI